MMPRKSYTLVNRTGKPEIILQVRFALCSHELAACWYNMLMPEVRYPEKVIQLARVALPTIILNRIKEFLSLKGGKAMLVKYTTYGEAVDLETVDMISAIFEDRFNFRSVE